MDFKRVGGLEGGTEKRARGIYLGFGTVLGIQFIHLLKFSDLDCATQATKRFSDSNNNLTLLTQPNFESHCSD